MPPLNTQIQVKMPDDGYFVTRNIVLNLQRLKFEEVGNFSIDITADETMLTRVPLRVMLLENENTSS